MAEKRSGMVVDHCFCGPIPISLTQTAGFIKNIRKFATLKQFINPKRNTAT
jgi:hypothetical protein